jgi:nitroreductase/NAD-dependent dihydropyrimidine dehydrogenase PreA subunit
MALFSLDVTACARDLHCVRACPVLLLEPDADGYPRPTEVAEERCIDCGHCVAVCPTQALAHARLPQKDFMPAQTGQATPEELDALMKNRRSIRRYKKKALPQGVLDELMESVRHAPTAVNSRHVRWRVTRNPEATRRLAGLVSEWTAQVGYIKSAMKVFEAGGDVALRGAPHVAFCTAPEAYKWAWSDCAIATTMLDLTANARGLGTCWAGLFVSAGRNYAPMQAALALPEGIGVFGALMFGEPAEHYAWVPPRPGEIVTWID